MPETLCHGEMVPLNSDGECPLFNAFCISTNLPFYWKSGDSVLTETEEFLTNDPPEQLIITICKI